MPGMRLPDVGTMFQSRYRLDAILGAGGFATVFRAADVHAGRTVALKVLIPSAPTGYPDEVVSRFQREVEVVANLHDEHTLTLFDFGTSEDGLLYMVTEFVPGEDLKELLARRARLEPPEVVHIVRQLLQSLREAHAAGLLHRDIKPANIRVYEYLGDPLRVKLLDFGIARPVRPDGAGITRDGAIVGTPRYMSPEQLLSEDLTPASDIYSLGVVAFEMLAGSAGLHGTQIADQLQRLATGHVFSVPEMERIGPDLCRILDKMSARDPAQRFRTADEALAALAALRRQSTRSQDLLPVTPQHHTPRPAPGPLDPRPSSGGIKTLRPTAGPETQEHDPRPRNAALIAGGLATATVVIAALALFGLQSSLPEDEVAGAAPNLASPRSLSIVRQTSGERPAQPIVDAGERGDMSGASSDEDDDAPRSAGCGAPPPFTGHGELRIMLGLTQRSVDAYIPSTYDRRRGHALVVMLHENAEPPAAFIRYSQFPALAEREGIILVAPHGGQPYAWKDLSRGVDTLRRAIDDATQELCIDLDRVYVVGHAAGGRIAEQAPCDLREVKAIATTSYRGTPADERNTCVPASPVPYIHFAPLHDAYNPVKGGTSCAGGLKISLAEKEAMWRERNQCEAKNKRELWHEQYDGRCFEWACVAPFVSCHIQAGRGWNDTEKRIWDTNNCDGPPAQLPYAETIWKFFQEHTTAERR